MSVIWEPKLNEEQSSWQRIAEKLTEQYFAPIAAEIDAEQRYPTEHLQPLLANGISGMFIPTQYGGGGASLTALAAAVETIATGCASTAAIMAALSLGAFPVLLGGSARQKEILLGGMSKEGDAVNFALSERGAGSDAAAIQTTAIPEKGGWRIQGEKCWLGNGGHSKHFIVFAKTNSNEKRKNITAFWVPREFPGVVIDHYEDKMGIRGTTTTNLKLDVWVSNEHIVGRSEEHTSELQSRF